MRTWHCLKKYLDQLFEEVSGIKCARLHVHSFVRGYNFFLNPTTCCINIFKSSINQQNDAINKNKYISFKVNNFFLKLQLIKINARDEIEDVIH
jgi:hypothetical protein